MNNNLLSVDWDYFVYEEHGNLTSYMESKKNIIDLWYKRYIELKLQGKSIYKFFKLSSELKDFWRNISEKFEFDENTKVYVSDSHALSYTIAKMHHCDTVYLFDAHSDLGYAGLDSLKFEVNCANWLGKLLACNQVKTANIIYSKFTKERPEYFKLLNNIFNIKYLSLENISFQINVKAIHLCRSGAWTPPWFDARFVQFVKELGISYKLINCIPRKWDINKLSFSDQIYYMMA